MRKSLTFLPSPWIGADPLRAGAGSGVGEADRMRRDRRERTRRGDCELDNGIAEGDVPPSHRMRCRGAGLINRELAVGPTRAGRGHQGQRPGAGVGPRRAQRAALIRYG
jgi:hypothetical protein